MGYLLQADLNLETGCHCAQSFIGRKGGTPGFYSPVRSTLGTGGALAKFFFTGLADVKN